jgi:hypothetical protein
VFAQFHQDSKALEHLKRSLHLGLSPTEISNNPAWQRFAGNREYQAMMAKAQEDSQPAKK